MIKTYFLLLAMLITVGGFSPLAAVADDEGQVSFQLAQGIRFRADLEPLDEMACFVVRSQEQFNSYLETIPDVKNDVNENPNNNVKRSTQDVILPFQDQYLFVVIHTGKARGAYQVQMIRSVEDTLMFHFKKVIQETTEPVTMLAVWVEKGPESDLIFYENGIKIAETALE